MGDALFRSYHIFGVNIDATLQKPHHFLNIPVLHCIYKSIHLNTERGVEKNDKSKDQKSKEAKAKHSLSRTSTQDFETESGRSYCPEFNSQVKIRLNKIK